MAFKISPTINEQTYIDSLNHILTCIEEERQYALDRYRKSDEQMTEREHFMLIGKNAVDFLRLASERTNKLFDINKDLKSIAFKDSDNTTTSGGGMGNNDQMMKEIHAQLKKEKEDAEKNGSTNDNDDEDI